MTTRLPCYLSLADALAEMIGQHPNWLDERQRLKNYLNHRILRFAVVGGGATVVHLVVATMLVRSFAAITIFNANAIAFSFAVFVSFIGHSLFTFKSKGSLLKFAITAIIGLGFNNVVAYAVLWGTGIKIVSIAIGTLVAPIIVYLLSSLWVFAQKKTDA